jgi:hypothetical protein
MRRLAPFVLLACLSTLASTALAVDRGQFGHVPPDIRAWFKSVIAPNGVPCCDESDGHRTTYDVRGGAYWVPIEGQWMQVPGARGHSRSGQPDRRGRGVVRASPRQHHHQLLRAGGRGLDSLKMTPVPQG